MWCTIYYIAPSSGHEIELDDYNSIVNDIKTSRCKAVIVYKVLTTSLTKGVKKIKLPQIENCIVNKTGKLTKNFIGNIIKNRLLKTPKSNKQCKLL